METKEYNVSIAEWKVIGDSTNFTVLGFGDDGNIYFYKEGEWKKL
mgnify:CR=1 FL=1